MGRLDDALEQLKREPGEGAAHYITPEDLGQAFRDLWAGVEDIDAAKQGKLPAGGAGDVLVWRAGRWQAAPLPQAGLAGTLTGAGVPLPVNPVAGSLWLVGDPVPTAVAAAVAGVGTGDVVSWDGHSWVLANLAGGTARPLVLHPGEDAPQNAAGIGAFTLTPTEWVAAVKTAYPQGGTHVYDDEILAVHLTGVGASINAILPNGFGCLDVNAAGWSVMVETAGRQWFDSGTDLGGAWGPGKGTGGVAIGAGVLQLFNATAPPAPGDVLTSKDAQGRAAWATPADPLPDRTQADEGDVLQLFGPTKTPQWSDNLVAALNRIDNNDIRLNGIDGTLGKVGNLFTANQAKPVTAGAWEIITGGSETAPGVYTASSTGTLDVGSQAGMIPVTPGQPYTAYVKATSTTSRLFRAVLRFYDNAARNELVYGPWVNGTEAVSVAVGVVPSWATRVRPYSFGSGNGAAGDVITVIEAGLWKGVGGVWQMPGAPIPAQSAIRANGSFDLSGAGSPEGKVMAPPGSTWTQTDSVVDKSGVQVWRKVSGSTGNTGWEVDRLDTGWLDISSLLHPNWAPATVAGYARARWKDGMVYLSLRVSPTAANTGTRQTPVTFFANPLPTGWSSYNSHNSHGVALFAPGNYPGIVGDLAPGGLYQTIFTTAPATALAATDAVMCDIEFPAKTAPTAIIGTRIP